MGDVVEEVRVADVEGLLQQCQRPPVLREPDVHVGAYDGRNVLAARTRLESCGHAAGLGATAGPGEALRDALAQLSESVRLALLYGSVAGRSDNAHSDIDLLIVSDELTLEAVHATHRPVEEHLGRRVSPTFYTVAEFRDRRERGNPFLARVLAGESILLIEDRDDLLRPRLSRASPSSRVCVTHPGWRPPSGGSSI